MRAFVCTWRGEWPKTSMWPFVGFNRPSSSLTVVDLPEPFGPSKPKTSPRRTSKSTLSTARALGRFQKSLNTFVSPRTDTTTSLVVCCLIFSGDVINQIGNLREEKHKTKQLTNLKIART